MKKIIALVFVTALLVTGCRKSDNPQLPDMERVPIPSVVRDAASDKFISPVDPNSFNGKVIVDLFYKNDVKPRKFDVVVIKNDNKANTMVLQADVTTFPVTVNITGAQLATLFGAPIQEGDRFDIGVDVTSQSGKKYPAFPEVGTPYGAGVNGSAGGISLAVRFVMLCRFNADAYSGDFKVITDQWVDYPVGAIITLARVDDNTVSFEYAADDAQPILVHVNPATNETSVALQEYGSYGGEMFSCKSAATPRDDDNVSPCEGTLTINLEHIGEASGSFGSFRLKLQKVQ
ncbi:MAG: hypothetical protein IPP72_10620 [Chitinophagaceae bacterium]|nr:hypothetical protein [Chitinophagaceae bacterium]